MNTCNDFIYFDRSEDWERAIGATFRARRLPDDAHEPIGQVDLRVALDEPYIVIVVQPIGGKDTWRYGGEVRQAWAFSKGGQIGSAFSTAQSKPTQLFVNKPQAIATPKNSSGKFRLLYDPPTWFKDVVVIGWVYRGKVENFTKDTLFDIGNTLGIDASLDENNLKELLLNQQALIEALQVEIAAIKDDAFSDEDINTIVNDVSERVTTDSNRISNRNEQALNTIINGLNNLLPPEQQVTLTNNIANQIDVTTEFI